MAMILFTISIILREKSHESSDLLFSFYDILGDIGVHLNEWRI